MPSRPGPGLSIIRARAPGRGTVLHVAHGPADVLFAEYKTTALGLPRDRDLVHAVG